MRIISIIGVGVRKTSKFLLRLCAVALQGEYWTSLGL